MDRKLMLAVADGKLKTVKFCLDHRANVNLVTCDGKTPIIEALHIAHERRRDRIFRYLLIRGANCCAKDPVTKRDLLSWACHLGHVEQVRCVLEKAGWDINLHQKDTEGNIALHHATLSGSSEIVQIIIDSMLKYRLNVDVANNMALTPYLLAKKLGYYHIAHILVTRGFASKCQFDTRHFRSGDEWAAVGRQERHEQAMVDHRNFLQKKRLQGYSEHVRQKNIKLVKLPTIQLVSDDNSTHTLQRQKLMRQMSKESVAQTAVGSDVYRPVKSKVSPRMQVSMVTVDANNKGGPSLLSPERKDHPIMFRNITALELLNAKLVNTCKVGEEGERLPRFMDILAQQQSDAFLPPIKKKTVPIEESKEKESEVKGVKEVKVMPNLAKMVQRFRTENREKNAFSLLKGRLKKKRASLGVS